MNINWFPGHMKKSTDDIVNHLNQVDVVCELLDARIPLSSRNPNIDKILQNKKRIIILNKSDMAEERENQKWIKYFSKKNIKAIGYNSIKDRNASLIYKIARSLLDEEFKKRQEKGLRSKEIRLMVVGIPNVGKSSFINNLSMKKKADVKNKPGVTRSKQWIKTNSGLTLLDTPGILWPKFESERVSLNLAFTGAIKDDILDIENLALKFIELINSIDKNILKDRYNIDSNLSSIEIMDEIAMNTGSILKGGIVDYERVSKLIIDDFRKLRLGRISLERVDYEENSIK